MCTMRRSLGGARQHRLGIWEVAALGADLGAREDACMC